MKHFRNIGPLFAMDGFYALRARGWQVDLADHRRHRPLFSVRELGKPCGHHLGHWCLRVGRLQVLR